MINIAIQILIWAVGIIAVVTVNALALVYLERKVSAHIQCRLGPMQVGFHGLLQTVADAVKLVSKEQIIPKNADKVLFILAPILAFFPVIVLFVVMPFAPNLICRDLNIGVLYVFSFASLEVIAIFMAGWSSNNKYSLLGAMRSVAQVVSYEVPLLLAVLAVVLVIGSLKMSEVVQYQHKIWMIFLQPAAFLIFMMGGLADTNRSPFDIPEAESELIAGFHTEYSGMRFALFFLSEYSNVFLVSCIATALFLGGWYGPFVNGIHWFVIKVYALVFVMMWVRWTLPRLRPDQLMNFCWKILTPIAILNLLVTGVVLKLVH
ncbi:MAG: NADH-quinone oxidoreductase subunit NuoH [Candidatus Omnitrophica bacterium]|nr:NADH-quinone oxidoreductase subunit NuoH [Candidatus Omnitrophota bacterium]